MVLMQLQAWLRDVEAPSCSDPRNKAWALEAADQLEKLLAGCSLLVAQYDAEDNFTLGGALTNAPFLAIKESLA